MSIVLLRGLPSVLVTMKNEEDLQSLHASAVDQTEWTREGTEVVDAEGRLIAVLPRATDPKTLRTVTLAPRIVRLLHEATAVLHDARVDGVRHLRGLGHVTEELRDVLDEINGHGHDSGSGSGHENGGIQ